MAHKSGTNPIEAKLPSARPRPERCEGPSVADLERYAGVKQEPYRSPNANQSARR